MKLLRTLAVMATVLSAPAFAAENYQIDPSHTQIVFEINHLGFSNTFGQFRKFDGKLTLDEANPANSTVSFTVQADSVDTSWEARDEHLRKADFFDVQKYPAITFTSTKVERTGENTAKLHGDLTMLGVTKSVIFDVKHNKTGPHPFNKKTVAGFTATATIKRSDFGMNYGLPAIGDDVAVTINMEANPASEASAQ